jgi:REP-associated tyrosine transposase
MRKTRKVEENALYHVMFRANLQENVFVKDVDKDMVENVVCCKKIKYHFQLKNHVIMDNHVHLLIKPVGDKEILSTIMQSIKSTIAINYNNKYNRKGHLWYDRFKSIIVRDSLHYRTVIKYITNNPVKANLTNDIYSYRYSGLYHLMRKQYYLIDEPDEIMRELYPFLPSNKMEFSTYNVTTQNMSSTLTPWEFLDFPKDMIR